MQTTFGSWFRARKQVIKEMPESRARELHSSRKLYFVVLGDPASPDAFLEINNEFLYVGFLDDLKREWRGYEFTETEPGKLFLKEIQVWEYDGDSDMKIFSAQIGFTPEGASAVKRVDLRTRDSETIETEDRIDVSGLFAPYPEFGKYEDLLRDDRIDWSRLPGYTSARDSP